MVHCGHKFHISNRSVALWDPIPQNEFFVAKIINKWESECPHCQDKIDINELKRRSSATKHPSSLFHESSLEEGQSEWGKPVPIAA